jgi:hypothetical protein
MAVTIGIKLAKYRIGNGLLRLNPSLGDASSAVVGLEDKHIIKEGYIKPEV